MTAMNRMFENATSLAECLGIDAHGVTRYIQKGWLKARHRGTRRTKKQGGDQWLIKEKDIRTFIIESVSILDFRKIDKFWLVEILVGDDNGLGPLMKQNHPERDESTESIESEIAEIFKEAQQL